MLGFGLITWFIEINRQINQMKAIVECSLSGIISTQSAESKRRGV